MALMTDATNVIQLDGGLDLRTPPLLAGTGTLLDCLNYEISADVGYRRWDGYERRDGYPGGGFFTWNSINIGMVGYPMSDWQAGDIIYRETDLVTYTAVGVVTEVDVANLRISYVPYADNTKLFVGNVIYRWDGVSAFNPYAVATASIDGRLVYTDPDVYLSTTRDYQELLRLAVQDAPSKIAGVYYSRDRSYEVLDAVTVEEDNFIAPNFIEGERVRYNGKEYIYGGFVPTGVIVSNRQHNLIPTGNNASPVDGDIVGIDTGTSAFPGGGSPILRGAKYGYLVWCGFPDRNFGTLSTTTRARILIRPGLHYSFNNGTYAGGSIYPPTGTYYATTSGGGTLVATGRVNQFDASTGTWAGNNAAGRANFEITSPGTGRTHLITGDEIHNAWPTTGSSRVMTLTSNSTIAKLAGTEALRQGETFYQWGTFNFYASVGSESLFLTNGAYRATIADPSGYSNVYTQDNAALDNPKYLTFHGASILALGFAEGSVQLSVTGVPWDYKGERGALEIGTGDDITGMLEGVNDSTLVFGRRSIRRITGTTDTTLELATVSANAGAYDYTCVNVGATPVFTGPTGVSTLEQTANYGDYAGERATANISTWLLPRIVVTEGGIDPVGARCAIPVRNKNQYRLFLNSGDVISVTFTAEGPKVMKGSYKLPGYKPPIPFAWGSSVSDLGDEHIEMVWDKEYARTVGTDDELLPADNRAYRLDNGWGFDGGQMPHYFDVVWAFLGGGYDNVTINQVRLHGLGYGVATLDLKTAGLETDYDQDYHTSIQEINMPKNTKLLYDEMKPVTGIIDSANWGLAIKIRINGTKPANSPDTEPPHICQAIQVYVQKGVRDS